MFTRDLCCVRLAPKAEDWFRPGDGFDCICGRQFRWSGNRPDGGMWIRIAGPDDET
jgi:hypothetical protein